MTGKTKSGFKFKVDERMLSDWRFTIAVAKTQAGTDLQKLEGVKEMIDLLLGEKGHQDLISHIAKANEGFVPADAIMAEVTEIMEYSKTAKN